MKGQDLGIGSAVLNLVSFYCLYICFFLNDFSAISSSLFVTT